MKHSFQLNGTTAGPTLLHFTASGSAASWELIGSPDPLNLNLHFNKILEDEFGNVEKVLI